jgi:hypothetical protein
MENFDLRSFLIENKLTTNSKLLSEEEVDEVNWKGLAAGAAMALGTLGAQGQEAPKTTQASNPITWQQMTQAQKAAKKAELIKQGGFERFKQYKDSISTDATNRREADFAKAAANRGMTTAEYSKYLVKNAKKPDAQPDGLEVGKACKRGEKKGSCSTGATMGGDSLRDVN